MNINFWGKNPVFQVSDLRKLLVRVLVTACENEVDIRDQHTSETLYTNFGQILRSSNRKVFFFVRRKVFFLLASDMYDTLQYLTYCTNDIIYNRPRSEAWLFTGKVTPLRRKNKLSTPTKFFKFQKSNSTKGIF